MEWLPRVIGSVSKPLALGLTTPNHGAAPWIEPVDALLSSTDTRQEMEATTTTPLALVVTVWSPLAGTSG